MTTRTKATTAALLLLGVFAVVLIAVHGAPAVTSGTRVGAPTITTRPSDPPGSTSAAVTVTTVEGAGPGCWLDRAAFAACSSPLLLTGLSQGRHARAVRAAAGTARVAAGLPFTITGGVTGLAPGAWRAVGATVHNPNAIDISVTSLTLAVAADSIPSGCRTAANVELRQSNVSSGVVLTVPAGRSVTLPAQGATNPRVRLRDLPTVNQDVCKGKSFTLLGSGTASG
jgi:hypothetical protein